MYFVQSPDRLLGHPTSHSIEVLILSPEENNCYVMMNMYFHLVPKLRMNGFIPPFTHMDFMVCIWRN
jgi:hypothetical protein